MPIMCTNLAQKLLLIRDSQSHLKWLCKMHKLTSPLAIVEEARIGKADGYGFRMT